jgi:hypothetical protein
MALFNPVMKDLQEGLKLYPPLSEENIVQRILSALLSALVNSA